MLKRKIVVCGASGNQGGSVVRALLSDGRWDVTALTRSIHSTDAQKLRSIGAEVIKADHKDQASMLGAFRGAYGVFAVTQPWNFVTGDYNVGNEIIQAKNIVWASRIAAVEHLVFSSFVNPLQEVTGCSIVDSKLTIESLLNHQEAPVTILRLPLYMESNSYKCDPDNGFVKGNFDATTPVPFTSLKDFGLFANLVFADPYRWIGQHFDVISDVISGDEIAALSRVAIGNASIRYRPAFKIIQRFREPEIYRMREFFEKFSKVDYLNVLNRSIFELRTIMPDALNVRDFLFQKYNSPSF